MIEPVAGRVETTSARYLQGRVVSGRLAVGAYRRRADLKFDKLVGFLNSRKLLNFDHDHRMTNP